MSSDWRLLPLPVWVATAWSSALALLSRLRSLLMVMVSLGAAHLGFFLTNLIVLRNVTPTEFGAFAVVMGLLPFGLNVHFAFVTYPTTMRLAEPASDAPRILGAAIVTGLAFSVPIALVIFLAALVVADPTVAAWASLASTVWLAQSTASKSLVARQKFSRAAIGDMICHLGMPLGVLWSPGAGALSIAVPFLTLMLTASLGLAFQAWQSDLRLRHLRPSGALFREFWSTGRVVVVGPLSEGISAQLVLWTLLAMHGKHAVAVFVALRSLTGISHPVIASIGHLVVPTVARAHRRSDARTAIAKGAAIAVPLATISLAFFGLIAVYASQMITFVYGAGAGYPEHAGLLRLLAFSYVFWVLAECTSAILRGLGSIDAEAKAQLAGSGTGVLIGLPVVAVLGPAGCALALLLGTACRFAVGLPVIWRTQRTKHAGRATLGKTRNAA